jgi:cysteinyl-tRNA synthetase
LESLRAAESALNTLTSYYDLLKTTAKTSSKEPSTRYNEVIQALENDLNTPAALGMWFSILNEEKIPEGTPDDLAAFERVAFAFGLKIESAVVAKVAVPAEVTALAEKRWAAKQAKDFATADALRKELTAAGWSMLDRKDGYSLEPAKK